MHRPAKLYNLDAIISVGYRVNFRRATHFRIWATGVLKEYMTKGFVLDDERLKQGKDAFGKDYFRELLERVRSIRASVRRIWQQVTDIFAECSIDYDRNSPVTKDFYAMVQNKFHYAITDQTAAENGEIAAVRIDGEVTMKHVYLHHNFIELRPENPAFNSIILSREDMNTVVIEGKAVGLCRDI